jgi:flagellar FliL protein
MADKTPKKTDPPAEEQAASPPAKKKGKLALVAGLAVLLLAGAGGGAWYFLKSGGGDAHATQAPRPQPGKPPVFVNLEPFTVNLQPEDAEQYLQVVTTLKLDDKKAADVLKEYMPEVRHKILLLLAGKKPSEIATPAGREKLASDIRFSVNGIIAAATGQLPEPVAPQAEAKPAEEGQPADQAKPVEGQPPAEADPAAAQATPAQPAPIEGPIVGVLFTSFIVQ